MKLNTQEFKFLSKNNHSDPLRVMYVKRGLTLTYLLTPWSRVLLEKLASLQLVKKFPAF